MKLYGKKEELLEVIRLVSGKVNDRLIEEKSPDGFVLKAWPPETCSPMFYSTPAMVEGYWYVEVQFFPFQSHLLVGDPDTGACEKYRIREAMDFSVLDRFQIDKEELC